MAGEISGELFKKTLRVMLTEIFEQVEGIVLDKRTSVFETLAGIDARQASTPMPTITIPPDQVGAGGGTGAGTSIAGQVEHVRFYLELMREYMQGGWRETVDWKASWRVVVVTEAEWEELKRRLRAECDEVVRLIDSFADFDDERRLGGAMAVLAHTAYHLGAIRQMRRVVG